MTCRCSTTCKEILRKSYLQQNFSQNGGNEVTVIRTPYQVKWKGVKNPLTSGYICYNTIYRIACIEKKLNSKRNLT